MHGNVSSHISKITYEFFEHKRFTGEKITEEPASSPDLNPIETIWSIGKMKLCEGGKQYNTKGTQ